MIDVPRFSTVEVCRLADLTYRQADYLAPLVFDEANPGSGGRRWWTPRQVVQAYVISWMRRHGFDGDEAAPVIDLVDVGVEYIIVPHATGDAYAAEDVLDALDGLIQPAVLVIRLPDKLRALLTGGRHPTLLPDDSVTADG